MPSAITAARMSPTSLMPVSIARIAALLVTALIVMTVSTAAAQTSGQPASPGLLDGAISLVESDTTELRLGSSLRLLAKGGALVEAINSEFSSATGDLALYLDGIRMQNVHARRLRQSGDELVFAFDLTRDPQDDANRKSWDELLALQNDWVMSLQATVGMGKNPAHLVDVMDPVPFIVAEADSVYTMLVAAITILVITFWLLITRSRMLVDEYTGRFSLGKSQMAFWGFLVVLTFAGVWILTGSMERIPAQVLILLGISAATGLSSVVIGNDVPKKRATVRQELGRVTGERDELQARQAGGAPLSPSEIAKLDAVTSEVLALQDRIKAGRPQGFFKDITSDSNGASFHRLQVVIWTLVLGGVFIHSVMQAISMPEFPEQLLLLMGISNGTYLGFKTAEK